MHRFFAQALEENTARLLPEEEAHCLRVLRMSVGESCQALLEGFFRRRRSGDILRYAGEGRGRDGGNVRGGLSFRKKFLYHTSAATRQGGTAKIQRFAY